MKIQKIAKKPTIVKGRVFGKSRLWYAVEYLKNNLPEGARLAEAEIYRLAQRICDNLKDVPEDNFEEFEIKMAQNAQKMIKVLNSKLLQGEEINFSSLFEKPPIPSSRRSSTRRSSSRRSSASEEKSIKNDQFLALQKLNNEGRHNHNGPSNEPIRGLVCFNRSRSVSSSGSGKITKTDRGKKVNLFLKFQYYLRSSQKRDEVKELIEKYKLGKDHTFLKYLERVWMGSPDYVKAVGDVDERKSIEHLVKSSPWKSSRKFFQKSTDVTSLGINLSQLSYFSPRISASPRKMRGLIQGRLRLTSRESPKNN